MMDNGNTQPLIPTDITNLPHDSLHGLPLLELFSRDVSLNKTLALQIDAILAQRLENEIAISRALNEGLSSEALNFHDAVKMHNGSKDSLSDLVKIKQLLGGLPTENKAVVHTIDTRALLEAVRQVRNDRVVRRGSIDTVTDDEVADG